MLSGSAARPIRHAARLPIAGVMIGHEVERGRERLAQPGDGSGLQPARKLAVALVPQLAHHQQPDRARQQRRRQAVPDPA